ncbi:hypothetical protein ABZ733_07225 [Streptomyces longwoodensis]|uniref:hypothetical protein n=1 Tax=Streptomyces longwoodensis TaxID=68231 RepID=UPI003407377B
MASFTDDFNRADSTDLGSGWVEVSGDWSIVSQRLSPGAAGGTIILRAAGAMASSDHYAQVTIVATTAASHGVWCRGNSNITSGYLFRNDGSSWNLFAVVGGSFNNIGSYAAAAAPGDVAKVQAVGSTIKCFVNGVERISVGDSSVPTGTSIGLRSESTSAIRFDDFSAADITAGATLTVATSVEAAQPVTGAKAATLATAGETAAAQNLTGAKAAVLSLATGQDSAQPLTGTKAATLSAAVEQGSAQMLTGAKASSLSLASSAESALPLTGAKAAVLTPAVELDTARPLTGSAPVALAVAATAETALLLTGAKTATLTPAVERDSARPLVVPSTTTPSPERTFTVPAERRCLAVPAEHRTLTVRR